MNIPGVIASILKNIKTEEDVVRYCSTDRKIRRICQQYSQQFFGKSYDEIVYSVLIRHTFPSLEYEFSLEDLYKYYKSYPIIWRELNSFRRLGEMTMCGNTHFHYQDKDYNDIVPSAKNIRYIAPYHRAIIEGVKKITFVFFRSNDKLPTNIFMYSLDDVITPFLFMNMNHEQDLSEKINRNSRNFLHDKFNRPIWEAYINDPYWKIPEVAKYYPSLSLIEELAKVDDNTPCDAYPAVGFERNEITRLIEKYFNLDHPVVEIEFNT